MSTEVKINEAPQPDVNDVKADTPVAKEALAQRDVDKSATQVLKEPAFRKAIIAEFIGTAIFVYLGTGISYLFNKRFCFRQYSCGKPRRDCRYCPSLWTRYFRAGLHYRTSQWRSLSIPLYLIIRIPP
jgi:hypothetical protein